LRPAWATERIQGQPELHSKTLSQNQPTSKQINKKYPSKYVYKAIMGNREICYPYSGNGALFSSQRLLIKMKADIDNCSPISLKFLQSLFGYTFPIVNNCMARPDRHILSR
jgi:hypothetical protein